MIHVGAFGETLRRDGVKNQLSRFRTGMLLSSGSRRPLPLALQSFAVPGGTMTQAKKHRFPGVRTIATTGSLLLALLLGVTSLIALVEVALRPRVDPRAVGAILSALVLALRELRLLRRGD